MRILLFLFLFVVLSLNLHSSGVKFYNINDLYGVSIKEAYSICKDEKGFIWAASKTGILRVSENECRVYGLPYKTTDVFSTKVVYRDSLLLAHTNNGQLFLYDELYDRFDFMLDLKQMLNYRYLVVSGIVIDKDLNLWIGTSVGLYKYENTMLKPVFERKTDVRQIAACGDHGLLYSTTEDIGLLDLETGIVKSIYEYASENEYTVSSFLYEEDKERLLIGTISMGLFYYNLKEKVMAEIPVKNFPRQPVIALRKNSDSTFLAGIDGQGVWELSGDGEKVLNIYKEDVNDPYTLRGNGVYDILCDKNGRVWIATFTGGLSFFDQEKPLVNQITHQINNSNSLVNNYVSKVLEDCRGGLWFATNNGISRRNVPTGQWHTYFQDKQDGASVFLALCEDDAGNIWAGSYSSGVYVLDGNTGNVINHYFHEKDNRDFSVKFVRDLFKDTQGDIWIGGTHNVVCYSKSEGRFVTYGPQPVNSLEELSSGKMLLACNYGLLSLDKHTGGYEVLFENCFVQDVVVVGRDIWVATSGEGLVQYDYENRTMNKYTADSGLVSNYINSLLYEDGYLWLGTENGLCRFDVENKQARTYLSTMPLSSPSFNVSSCIKSGNGNLIWGTNAGVVFLNPDLLPQEEINGVIFIQDITVSGCSIRENEDLLNQIPINNQSGLRLDYGRNNFILELLPLGMHTSGSKFSWKLDGFDADWSSPSVLRFITYTNIPDGQFNLKIRMYDGSLSKILDERSLAVKVIPPFWKTGWFRLSLVVLILGIIFYLWRVYSVRLKERHARDKIRFFTNMAHDIRTSLTLINAPIDELNKAPELSEKSRYYLGLATEQTEKMSLVANQLLDFQKVDTGKEQLNLTGVDIVQLTVRRVQMFEAFARKRNIGLHFSSCKDLYITSVDELKMEKVIDNLLSNAIKYSPSGGKVDVTLDCGEKEWSLEVRDYGIGIPGDAKEKLFREFYRGENAVNSKIVGSGIGLLLVKDYIAMHNGHVHIDSKEGEGSSFRVVVPYEEVNVVLPSGDGSVAGKDDHAYPYAEMLITENDAKKEKKAFLLIVEDNDNLREFLNVLFGDQFFVSTAQDGVEAWEQICRQTPDLIISDVMMPNMDGFELCKKIKTTFETSHIPVLLLTALSDKTSQMEGLGYGADDYVTKPFDMPLLLQRIKTILKNREIVREKALKLIKHTEDEEPLLSNSLNDRFVKKALEVVRENISNTEFGKDEFASAMNASPSLLYKKMKALMGQSPADFIRVVRFDYALELLRSRKYTVAEVSEMCGFTSASYFSTAFKKHFGKSPIEV
ncbi:MAG: response regulator [Tannerella sp.]|jgi:signal transduction histidine kinase/DNA-binding response OmpR family regulator/ligand-binding sensor domain-containing protein|nr:response regulator [Tannerella sp.]